MLLKDYVEKTLIDITDAVANAQMNAKLWIAPGMVEGEPKLAPQMVKFEVEVVVSKNAEGGVKVWSLGDAKASGGITSLNRLTFEVPVYFQSKSKKHPQYFEDYPHHKELDGSRVTE
jgi:hypothetical protein